MTSFLRDSAIKKFDIIAIQKSWINAYANTTHHSLKNSHILIYSNSIEMKKALIRVCMYVIKRIFIDDLKITFRSEDVMIAQIRLHETHYLHLHNVYNESDILSFSALQHLRSALKLSSKKEFKDHFIVKDFNIHHSSWDDAATRSNSRSLEMLLMMNEFRLQFNLSRKTSTYFHFQKSKSIIDMCLTTKNLNDRILICKTRFDLNHDSNHMLIETILNVSINETSSFERFNWDRLNMKKFKSILNYLLSDQSMSQLFDKTQIDVYTKFVCSAITDVIDAFISKFKTSARVIFDFDETCNLTQIRANQVRRSFQDELVAQKINTEQALHVWRKIKIIRKRIIRKILRITHRNVVFSAIEDVQKTWKLTKWTKNRLTSFKFIISFFRRSDDIMIFIKKNKNSIFDKLVLSFFRRSESRRHSEINILEKHRLFWDLRKRDKSNNCQNHFEHRLKRKRHF